MKSLRLATPEYKVVAREDIGGSGFLETHVAQYPHGNLIKEIAVTAQAGRAPTISIALCFIPNPPYEPGQ